MSRRKRQTIFIFFILFVVLRYGDTAETEIEQRSADGLDPGAFALPLKFPYLEYILREFLFKTISPAPPVNNKLHKELLEAPFYTGPFPAFAGNLYDYGDTSEVLSSGYVYHLGEGGWIICQEGCIECEICMVQRIVNLPTVKWILRKIRRLQVPLAGFYSHRNDIQLTILPQADNNFHMRNLAKGSSYVYVSSKNVNLQSFTDTLIRTNKDYPLRYPFGTAERTESKKSSSGETFSPLKDKRQRVEHENPEEKTFLIDSELDKNSTLIQKPKVSREKNRPLNKTESSTPPTLFRPSTDPVTESILASECEKDKNAQLILGRDESGQKHVVHIVPAGDLDQEIVRPSTNPRARLIYRHPITSIPLNKKNEERTLYRKIFQRVIDSLNSHKDAIEKFLLSSKRDAPFSEQEERSIIAQGVFEKDEKNVTKNEMKDEIISDLNYDDKEIVDWSKETSSVTSASITTAEKDENFTKNYERELNLTIKKNNGDKFEHDSMKSDERTLKFEDDSKERKNDSEQSLILKEVAKSVVSNPADSLQGFNPLTNKNVDQETEDPVPTNLTENTTGNIAENNFKFRQKREKSLKHV